jgi:putative DNA methylase
MSHEIFTRRKLPHWYVPGAMHFITYRMAGCIPFKVQRAWRLERKQTMDAMRRRGASRREIELVQKRFFGKYDAFLDQNRAVSTLALPEIAAVICENLHHHDGGRYRLLSFCVMHNHVHVLLQPLEPVVIGEGVQPSDEARDSVSPLTKILHSLKSYTANRANEILGRRGKFWQTESYDHWVRDDDELERIILYINHNPVKAGLVIRPHDWIYGSAHERFERDGLEDGALW